MDILLVDDVESDLTALEVELLSQCGHTLHTAAGKEAAETLAASLSSLDALITCAWLRDGSGFALRDSLLDSRPGLTTVFMAEQDLAGTEELSGCLSFTKPVDVSTLLASLPVTPKSSDPPTKTTSRIESADQKVALEISENSEDGRWTGHKMSDYRLEELIYTTGQTETYAAVQISIERTVLVDVLRSEFVKDHDVVQHFINALRAKAAVNHPHITAVYEAKQKGDALFYAREIVEGVDLAEMATTGKELTQKQIFEIARVTSDAFCHLADNDLSHLDLEPEHLVLDTNGEIRVANIASHVSDETVTENSIKCLGKTLLPLLPEMEREEPLGLLLKRLQAGEFSTWTELSSAIKEADQLSSSSRSVAPPQVKLPRRSIDWKRFAITLGVLGILAVGAMSFLRSNRPIARQFNQSVYVPSGTFLFRGEEAELRKPFWIDTHEVTIAQYAEFLEEVAKLGGDDYTHSKQPDGMSFEPKNWSEYYPVALRGGLYRGNRLDVNCPVFGTNWWCAYAYATSKGKRLPTEQEWEIAAAGRKGNQQPWGNEFDATKANTGVDYSEKPADGGKQDGFNAWAPVDAFPDDNSEVGMVGAGGNVSEWTSSKTRHPDFLDKLAPLVRGASFTSKNPRLELRRALPEGHTAMNIGFRMVSNEKPKP